MKDFNIGYGGRDLFVCGRTPNERENVTGQLQKLRFLKEGFQPVRVRLLFTLTL